MYLYNSKNILLTLEPRTNDLIETTLKRKMSLCYSKHECPDNQIYSSSRLGFSGQLQFIFSWIVAYTTTTNLNLFELFYPESRVAGQYYYS